MNLIQADARIIPLAGQSVHMVATSPPYWGLRDYGIPDQLGLEPAPDDYIAAMMEVMDELWRVLRDDGTCWINIGDNYAGSGKGAWAVKGPQKEVYIPEPGSAAAKVGRDSVLPAKNLMLMPFRFALAVQERGWIVRQDIIWHKPNPMPESVKDRPTTAHEHVFLMSKRARYFYDGDAIREKQTGGTHQRGNGARPKDDKDRDRSRASRVHANMSGPVSGGRNCRSVWTVATQPYPGAHFATFPEKLVGRMIKAGASEKGCCPECGNQWERVVEKGPLAGIEGQGGDNYVLPKAQVAAGTRIKGRSDGWKPNHYHPRATTGWRPTCEHDLEPVPAIVLDPFVGSGTTNLVARKLGRRAIGLDLSFEYLRLAQERNRQRTLWEAA